MKKSSSFHGVAGKDDPKQHRHDSMDEGDRCTSLRSFQTTPDIEYQTKILVLSYLGLPVHTEHHLGLERQGSVTSSDEELRRRSPRRSPRRSREDIIQSIHSKGKSFDGSHHASSPPHRTSLPRNIVHQRKVKSLDLGKDNSLHVTEPGTRYKHVSSAENPLHAGDSYNKRHLHASELVNSSSLHADDNYNKRQLHANESVNSSSMHADNSKDYLHAGDSLPLNGPSGIDTVDVAGLDVTMTDSSAPHNSTESPYPENSILRYLAMSQSHYDVPGDDRSLNNNTLATTSSEDKPSLGAHRPEENMYLQVPTTLATDVEEDRALEMDEEMQEGQGHCDREGQGHCDREGQGHYDRVESLQARGNRSSLHLNIADINNGNLGTDDIDGEVYDSFDNVPYIIHPGMTPQSEVARRLSIIGDEVSREFGNEISRATQQLLSMPRNAVSYEKFKEMADTIPSYKLTESKQVSLFLEFSKSIKEGFQRNGQHLGLLVDYTTQLLVERTASYIIQSGAWYSLADSLTTGSEPGSLTGSEPGTPSLHRDPDTVPPPGGMLYQEDEADDYLQDSINSINSEFEWEPPAIVSYHHWIKYGMFLVAVLGVVLRYVVKK